MVSMKLVEILGHWLLAWNFVSLQNKKVEELKDGVTLVRTELSEDIACVRTDFAENIFSLRTDMV